MLCYKCHMANVMNREMDRIVKILKTHRETLAHAYPLKRIGVFGSYVRGDHTRDSDIDLLVEFARPVSFFTFLELEDFLRKKLKRKIDLVTRNALHPALKKEILRQIFYI